MSVSVEKKTKSSKVWSPTEPELAPTFSKPIHRHTVDVIHSQIMVTKWSPQGHKFNQTLILSRQVWQIDFSDLSTHHLVKGCDKCLS